MASEEKVLDASVILAALRGEPARVGLIELIDGCVLSAVNLCEVLSKAAELGLSNSLFLSDLLKLVGRIEPFTAWHGIMAAGLRVRTMPQGLSFGDRACLALGMELNAVVYTAERRWAELSLSCEVRLIR